MADDAAASNSGDEMELDLDIADLLDVMDDEPSAAEGTSQEGPPQAKPTAPADDEEEEEEEESGVVTAAAAAAAAAGIAVGAVVAVASTVVTGAESTTAAPVAKPKKRKSTAKDASVTDERPTKATKNNGPASPTQGDANAAQGSAAPSGEVVPIFSSSALRRVLAQMVAPVPPARIPTALTTAFSELGRMCVEEVIAEALRIRNGPAQALQRGKLQRGTSQGQAQAQPPAASDAPLKPSLLREAYRRLVNAGTLPSRAGSHGAPAQPLVGLSGALEEEGLTSRGRMKRQVAWRR